MATTCPRAVRYPAVLCCVLCRACLAGEWDHVVQRYSGHRNSQTVKGVAFLGCGGGGPDEFVVSGSDCGHMFVWGKADGRLRQLRQGDQHVVNCLEPHPHMPGVMATSGAPRGGMCAGRGNGGVGLCVRVVGHLGTSHETGTGAAAT